MSKRYLGDSVYADWDGYRLTLTTENGVGASNTIYLEPEVYTALVAYVEHVCGASTSPEVDTVKHLR